MSATAWKSAPPYALFDMRLLKRAGLASAVGGLPVFSFFMESLQR